MNINLSRKIEISIEVNTLLLDDKDVTGKISDSEATLIMDKLESEILQRIGIFDYGNFNKELIINSKKYLISGFYSQNKP